MPQIHEYTNEVQPGGPGPSEERRQIATGGVGDAVSALGNAIMKAGSAEHQQQAQQETSQLGANFAKLQAESSVKLDQDTLNADEDDTKTLSSDFMEDYNNKIDELGNSLSTPEAQEAFQKMAANGRGQFLMSSMHNQISKTGQYAVDNLNSTVDNNSTQVRNDPSSIDSVLAQQEIALKALGDTHSIDDSKVDELRAAGEKQLYKAQFEGYLNLPNGGPQIAQNLLNKGEWDDQFSADELQQMQAQAKTWVNASQVEQNRKDKVLQDAADAKQEAAMQSGLKDLYSNGLSTQDVLKNPDLDYSHQVQLLNMIDRKNKGDIDTDPAEMKNLFARVVAPDGTPGKITSEDQLNQAYINGKISLTDLDKLRTEMSGRKTEQGKIESDLKSGVLKVAEQSLVKPSGLTGLPDPQGEAKLQAFRSWYLTEYDAQRKAGVSAVDLTTPGSDKYLGDKIKAFMSTAQDILQPRFSNAQDTFQAPSIPTPLIQKGASPSVAASPSAGAKTSPIPPRRVGETISDYMKRTSK